MKILIADDQEIFQRGLSKLLEVEPEIDIVGIAENGQIALEKSEQLSPDLILMDLYMPVMDGITATEKIVQKFPQIKVIILTGSDDNEQLLPQAIGVGAKGFLLKRTLLKGKPKDNFLSAISAVKRGQTLYLEPISGVTSSISHTKLFEEVNHKLKENRTEKPELSHLENWNNFLASETINCWLTSQNAELPSWSEALTLLGIQDNSRDKLDKFLEQGESSLNLFHELELLLESISDDFPDRNNFREHIELIEKELIHWYYGRSSEDDSAGCLGKLEFNFQRLRTELESNFQQFINSFWAKTSPQPCLEYLQKLEVFLLNIYGGYESEKLSYIQQENAGIRAYNYLLSEISQEPNKISSKYPIVIKALFHIYKCKIKAEICSFIRQIFNKIIQINQLYVENLISTNSFLKRIKNSLLVPKNNNIILSMLFQQMCLVKSPEALCKELEAHWGHSLNKWGVCDSLKEEEIKNILLEKISGITREIYEQLKQEFLKNFSAA